MATALTTAALGPATWPLFEELVERHAGVWGGCWCMGFHHEGFGSSAEENHRRKRDRVASGSAFAALVLAEGRCVGWCQYGPATDLTRLKNRKAYEQGSIRAPDWRITCFFVDRQWRHRGVANLALQAAVGLIAAGGGGVVESYPEDAADRRVSGSFLHNGTLAMFVAAGFAPERKIGKHRWVVRRQVTGD